MTKSQIKAALRRAAARCVERNLRWCLCSALPEQEAFNAAWSCEDAPGGVALLAGDESAYFLLIVAEVLE